MARMAQQYLRLESGAVPGDCGMQNAGGSPPTKFRGDGGGREIDDPGAVGSRHRVACITTRRWARSKLCCACRSRRSKDQHDTENSIIGACSVRERGDFEIEGDGPLGIIFRESGDGIAIRSVVRETAAAESQGLLDGMLLIEVESRDASQLGYAATMSLM